MLNNIAGAANLNAYVNDKIRRVREGESSFLALFDFMFSERENIFWEESDGYRIIRTTYGESADRIRLRTASLFAELNRLNIPSDAVIGLYMNNSLDWIEIFWSILLSGRRPLLLNLRMSDEMLESVLESTDAAAVVSDGKVFSCPTFTADRITAASAPAGADICGDEILLCSSGTSESVKICAYTAGEIIAQISNAAEIIRENKRIKQHYNGYIKQLTLLPFYHVFGLFAVYFWFGFFSRTFVQLPDMSPQTLLNTVRKHKVTHIFAVPMFWDTVYRNALKTIRSRGEKTNQKFHKAIKLADRPVVGPLLRRTAFREIRENMFGESLLFCISGGSAIRPEVLRFFNGIGYHLANGYGMTEIGITSVELSVKARVLNLGSIGKPMRSVRYELTEDGILQVSGDSVAHAIVEGGVRRELRERSILTNDVMQCREGRYYIQGRLDDVIISPSGENINPDIAEQAFDLPAAKGFCLIPLQENGQTIPALVVSVKRYTSPGQIAELSGQIREQLEGSRLAGQVTKILFVTDELMAPNEIKINRKRLVRQYQEGSLHPVGDSRSGDWDHVGMMEMQVIELMAGVLDKDPDDIGPESDFFLDQGGSSLDYYMLVGKLQDEFGVSLQNELSQTLSTARKIVAFLMERASA